MTQFYHDKKPIARKIEKNFSWPETRVKLGDMKEPKKLYDHEIEAFYEIAGRCWNGDEPTRDRADYQAIMIMTKDPAFSRLDHFDLLPLVGTTFPPVVVDPMAK